MVRKPGTGTVLAMVAIVIATAGTATAATSALINGHQIKKGSIPITALSSSARKALVGRTGPVGAIGPRGPQGTQGVQGIQGIQGVKGDTGSSGVSGYTVVQNNVTVLTGAFSGQVSVTCPAGDSVIGGGGGATGAVFNADELVVGASYPLGSNGWEVDLVSPTDTAITTNYGIVVRAVCAKVG
jgi:hypothetical protein